MGVLLLALTAAAQSPTGDLYGKVVNQHGVALPGVTLTLTGIGAPRVATTSAAGAFRYRNLDPGGYTLSGTLENFGPIEVPTVTIRAAKSTTLELTMALAVVEEIVVTYESPLVDGRRVQKGVSLERKQLENIPTARDPWVLLNQTPGIVQDRVNVGGNESGQQSQYIGTGADANQNLYLLDGVQITEMFSATSMSYFDFDQFEEVNITTGGADLALSTPGVTINMVTKRGGNSWKIQGRTYLTPGGTQSSRIVDESDFAPGQEVIPTNEIRNVYDHGVQGGGPLLRDQLWGWASASRNEIDLNVASGAPDDTVLENLSLKLNAQLSAANSAVLWGNWNGKTKDGRGAAPDRSPETTWDQEGDSTIWKLEDSHLVSPKLFLSVFYADVDSPFSLTPKGSVGSGAPEALLDVDGVWRANYIEQVVLLESQQALVDGSYFLSAGSSTHEIDGGISQNESLLDASVTWPGGRDLFNLAGTNFGLPDGPVNFFGLARAYVSGGWIYRSAWIQDTWTRDRWTVDFGLRYDRQKGFNEAASIPANPVRPDVFPAIDYPGDDGGGFVWEDLQPRIGITYALGPRRQALLRAGYSQFAQQLVGLTSTARTHPLGVDENFNFPTAIFLFFDLDGDHRFAEGEPNQFLSGENFDLLNPTVNPNRNDPDLEAQLTDELVLAVEHALTPELVASLHLTYRQTDRIHDFRLLVRDESLGGEARVATTEDYVLDGTASGTLPNGESYSEGYYALREGLSWTGGKLLTNGGRTQEYRGATLAFDKRLSNCWTVRGSLTWSDWEWNVGPDFRQFDDPTDELDSFDNDGQQVLHWSDADGKQNMAMGSSWTASLSGLVQIAPASRWEFDIAGNLTVRDGFPQPYYHSVAASDGLFRNVQVTQPVDRFRLDDLYLLDVRFQKEFPFRDLKATFSVDVFNALNEGTVLQRDLNLGGARPDYLAETLSPRVWRFGLRFAWR